MELYEMLSALEESDWVPFHMPGHKRNPGFSWGLPFGRDITEIGGFDNLHHAQGVLRDAQEELARQVGARRSFFLVNGSTAGILMALSACLGPGEKLCMARGCHKAVYHGVILRNLRPVYLAAEESPEGINLSLSPSSLEETLEREEGIRAVFLTSPTYDGVVSDIRSMAKICHARGIPLIVDEAHGAHLRFSPYFPASAAETGADVVIQSFHKTLPALTQTAVLHVCSGRVDAEKLAFYSGVYQTSSPSYLLLESLTRCVEYGRERARGDFAAFTGLLKRVREELEEIPGIRLLTPDCFAFDPSKLLLSASSLGIGGGELMELLRRDHLEMEMEAEDYVLALTSVGDTKESFERLLESLWRISRENGGRGEGGQQAGQRRGFPGALLKRPKRHPIPPMAFSPGEALEKGTRRVPLREAGGLISAEFAYLYPPGIPLIVPGEILTEEVLSELLRHREAGRELHGLRDEKAGTIWVTEQGS